MLMKALDRLYDRIEDEVVPAAYKAHSVEWFIQLDEEGQFLGFVSTESDTGPLEAPVPYRRRSGVRPPPYLLVDTPAYVLGLGLDRMSDQKAAERHETFQELVSECAEETSDARVAAVSHFLEAHVAEARSVAPGELRDSDLISFLVGGERVFNLPVVRRFWAQMLFDQYVEGEAMQGECLLCGREKPIIQRHPIELQVGPDRAQLITANENAFESYGLQASEIAPVCYDCAGRYGVALRHLLDSETHSFATAGGTYVFWTREPTEFNPWDFVREPNPEEVRRLLGAPFRAEGVPHVEENEFYALCVTANQGRLVIRSLMRCTVPEVRRNLARYFEAQRLLGVNGDESPIPLNTLILSLVRRFDDLSPQVVPALLEFALAGTPLPTWLVQQAVQRARADTDNRITRPRAALMRMVFESRTTNSTEEGPTVTPELDTDNKNPAYLCGRMLAVLEQIQRAAIPGVKATLVDKYFGTACSAPATVFGTLIRNAQAHLAKLRKTNEGAYHALQNRLSEISAAMPAGGFPRTLSLQDQALFGLGYYQQKAADRAARRAAAEAKDSD